MFGLIEVALTPVTFPDELVTQLTSSNWLDKLSYLTTLIIAFGYGIYLFLRKNTQKVIPPSRDSFQYTLAQNELERQLLIALGDLSFVGGYEVYGSVGRLSQLLLGRDVSYRAYKQSILDSGLMEKEWFTVTWDEYFMESDVITTQILSFIQTSLFAKVTRRTPPLTIVKDYYSICFDWLQELGFNEGSKFLYPETFLELVKFLELLWISDITLNLLEELHRVSKDSTTNHKHILWNIILI